MNTTRIAELLARFLGPADDQGLTSDDFQRISIYIDLLLRWNTRINLTAIRNEEEIVTRHFGESLFAARHLFPGRSPGDVSGTISRNVSSGRSALQGRVKRGEKERALASEVVADTQRPATDDRPEAHDQRRPANDDPIHVADLGSGAGFPGIPIKLWAPQIHMTLIESNHKKAAFLREVVRTLTLTNIDIRNTRAESLLPATFNLVTLRAVERFEAILPTAASLVAPGDSLALLIGASQQPIARSTLSAVVWSQPIPIPGSNSRIVLTATVPPPSQNHYREP